MSELKASGKMVFEKWPSSYVLEENQKIRRECVQTDALGGIVTDDGKKGKKQSAHENFVGQADG